MDALPADIRAKAEKVLADSGSDAAAVVRYLLGAPGPARAATKLENFPERWPISQLLPTRRAVNFGVNAKQLATFNEKDGVVSAEGDFSTYNVFLMLPLPRRPKPHFNLVLTKLGGQGPFLVLSTSNPSSEMVTRVSQQCKYSDTKVDVSQAVPVYIGAQEGLLYLLSDFLFFGFKKPLKLFLVAEIESISFTVVTSRTFNIVVKLLDDSVHEFEKIPHDFHARILAFIDKNNLNDESLAEERKAKRQKTGPSALEEALDEDKKHAEEEDDDEDDDDDDEEDDDDFEDDESD